jgi:hypothetical protein
MKKILFSFSLFTLTISMTSCGIDVPFIPFVENEAPIESQPSEYVAVASPVQTLP